jgi:rhodanese-related sulfurtransferase
VAIKQIDPKGAKDSLDGDERAVYLDVRTEAEFERGHPPGALNIPVLFLPGPGQPAIPNERFADEVARVIAPDRRIFVGCQVGGRSQRACEILATAGFSDLTNVQGGFGGARDRAGNVVAPGWTDSGLPVETGQPGGRCYADLKLS